MQRNLLLTIYCLNFKSCKILNMKININSKILMYVMCMHIYKKITRKMP